MFEGKRGRLSKLIIAISFLSVLAACGGAERLEEHRLKADAFFDQGDYEKARLEYKNVVLIDPKDLDGHFRLAETQEKLGNFQTAVGEYKNVLTLDENNIPAKIGLGYLFAGGAPELSQQYVDEVFQLETDNADALVIRSMLSVQGGKLDDALSDASRGVSLAPDNVRAAVLLSNLYLQTDQAPDAELVIQPLLARFPKDISLRNQMARIYWKQSKYSETISELEVAIKLKPESLKQYVFLSGLYLQNGEKSKSEEILRRAISAMPGEPSAKLLLVDFLLKEVGAAEAEKELQLHISQEDTSELQGALARLYLNSGERDKAVGVYEKIAEGDYDVPAVLDAKNKLAEFYIQNKRVEEGQALLEEILEESSKNQDALMLRGRLAMMSNDPEKAINDFRTVLKQAPESGQVRRVLAKAQEAAGNLELAQLNLQKAVDISPDNFEIKIELAKVSAQMGQNEVARDRLNEVLIVDPGNSEASRALVALQLIDEDKAGAIKTLKELQKSNPNSAFGHYLEGRLHQADKNFDSSNASLERALLKQPGAIEPLVSLVTNYLYKKDSISAYRVINRALDSNPKHVVALNLKGEIDMALGKEDDAQEAFEEAVKIKPDWWVPYRNLASGYLREGRPQEAIQVMEGALESTHQSSLIKTELAVLYSQNGQRGAARRMYKDVIKEQPNNYAAINNLAMLLVDEQANEKDLGEAKELAAALPDENIALLDTKAWVLFRSGEQEEAEELTKKGLEIRPDSPDLNYHYALMLAKRGSVPEAIRHMKVAVQKGGKGFTDLESAQVKLKQLISSK